MSKSNSMARMFINPRLIEYIVCVDMIHGIGLDNEEHMGRKIEKFELLHQAFFSLKPSDMESRRFEFRDRYIEIKPSSQGLPIVRDFDILIYMTSGLQKAFFDKNWENLSTELQFSAQDFLKFSGRGEGGGRDQALLQSLERLSGSEISTNIPTPESAGKQEENRFNLITFDAERNSDGSMGMVNITLPLRFYRLFSTDGCNFYHGRALHPDYFKLKPLQRVIYLIAIVQCTSELPLTLTLERLHGLTGVSSPLRKFRDAIKEIIEQPLIEFQLTADENFTKIYCTRPSDYVQDAVEYISNIFGEDESEKDSESES